MKKGHSFAEARVRKDLEGFGDAFPIRDKILAEDFPEFESPREVVRHRLERDVQSACVRWARDRGWWARKFQSPANRAVPDYIFGKDGFTLFVEFKAPGKGPTEDQKEEHEAMLAVGLVAHVIDDVAKFKKLVLLWERQMAEIQKVLT